MTVKQAILSFPGLSDISDNFLEKLLLDRSLNGAEEYSVSKMTNTELCAADCYEFMLNSPNFQEGGLSLTLNRAEMRKTASKLYRQNGETSKAESLLAFGKSISRTERW